MRKFKGQILLVLAALIWGSAFVFQKLGAEALPTFTFNACRFTIGAVSLIPLMWLLDGLEKKNNKIREAKWTKTLFLGGTLCGLTQFSASFFQQYGLAFTTAGKAGFITQMDIAVIPFILILLKKRVSKITWLGVVLAMFGMYLLSVTEDFHIQFGDGLVFCCAVIYAVQILLIDYFVDRSDAVRLAMLQFAIAAVLSAICMLIFDSPDIEAIKDCWIPILYTGILEIAAAYTLEIFGQKSTPPAISSIILGLEGVFAVVCGSIFLHEHMTGREGLGCVIVLIAVIVTQLDDIKK